MFASGQVRGDKLPMRATYSMQVVYQVMKQGLDTRIIDADWRMKT